MCFHEWSDTYKQKIQRQHQKLICDFKNSTAFVDHTKNCSICGGAFESGSQNLNWGGGRAVEILNRLILLFSFIFSLEISLLHLVFIFFKFKI